MGESDADGSRTGRGGRHGQYTDMRTCLHLPPGGERLIKSRPPSVAYTSRPVGLQRPRMISRSKPPPSNGSADDIRLDGEWRGDMWLGRGPGFVVQTRGTSPQKVPR